jgi:hypothetical protein
MRSDLRLRSRRFSSLLDTSRRDLSAPGPTVAAVDGLQGCREQASLSQQELHVLDTLPGAANEIDFTVLSCDLEAGHAGTHLALGQMYGERARWLQWVPGALHEWLDIAGNEHCDAHGPPASDIPNDAELCLLPAAHPGRHSFEIRHAQA